MHHLWNTLKYVLPPSVSSSSGGVELSSVWLVSCQSRVCVTLLHRQRLAAEAVLQFLYCRMAALINAIRRLSAAPRSDSLKNGCSCGETGSCALLLPLPCRISHDSYSGTFGRGSWDRAEWLLTGSEITVLLLKIQACKCWFKGFDYGQLAGCRLYILASMFSNMVFQVCRLVIFSSWLDERRENENS